MNTDKKGSWQTWLWLSLVLVLSPLLLPAVLLWLIFLLLGKLLVLLAVWVYWIPRGKDMLLVYSRSPHWMEYFETGLIPRLGRRVVVLNWSDRARWPRFDLRTSVFRAFKGEKSFNPMALVFKPFRWPVSFRFYEPFKQRKHGNEQPLHDLEADLLAYIAKPRG